MTAFFLAASQWASDLIDPLDDAIVATAETFELWCSTHDEFLEWSWPVVQEVVPEISAEEEQAFFALELEDLPY